MDAYEATKVVFARIQALDPDHASKIMGVLLIQDHGEKDMIRLAFGPEHVLQSVVAKARADLGLKSPAPAVPVGPSWGAGGGGGEEVAFAGEEVGYDGGGGGLYPDEYGCWSPASGGHRRSYSLSDAEAAGGWKPCLYFARGYCKNGSTCRFLHGLPDDAAAAAAAAAAEQELLMRAKAAAARSQLMATAFPFSPSQKGVNFLLQQQQQQQQSESQRVAAAAALLLGGDDVQKYALRSPRMERADLAGSLANPGARQIYLTFPADSTFSEEDVSNYFSIYGPVQDVRIPYQQKRMFGFVTFVYPETVKLILAKGNPHFVCDARVLVKPYKEKGKVPDKFRKLPPPPHQAEFAGCTTPTGLLDSRDPFELPPPQIGPRMLYGSMASQEALLRRKLEEQQQVAELQQAIELQGRRFMGLQLIDVKNRNHRPLNSPIGSPIAVGPADTNSTGNANAGHLEDATSQDGKLSSGAAVGTTAASAAISAIAVEGKHEQQQEENGNDSLPRHHTVNSGEGCPEPASAAAAAPNVVCEFQESGLEHNLPDSPFASPTKASIDAAHIGGSGGGSSNSSSSRLMASSLFPPTSTLDMASYNSCFLQMSRFSPGHGAIGM